ncbi:hypothetical protein TNIN_124681 [Trichonephila inaurata madagascariensis]|uniref:Uncharacterized protein n=1 Tax=Trichonephila inaurata madagascariensis TaxID=2747483 RepID=A0A8X6WV41_9ARAC|nr:hypothetical protein TNIN_124681 [Trichonephila inaurata madagascariensis]
MHKFSFAYPYHPNQLNSVQLSFSSPAPAVDIMDHFPSHERCQKCNKGFQVLFSASRDTIRYGYRDAETVLTQWKSGLTHRSVTGGQPDGHMDFPVCGTTTFILRNICF